MRSAVIVSTARTPIGRAYRGAFNALPSPSLAAHAIRAAVERAGLRTVADGQAVTFDIESGRDGRQSARNLALA